MKEINLGGLSQQFQEQLRVLVVSGDSSSGTVLAEQLFGPLDQIGSRVAVARLDEMGPRLERHDLVLLVTGANEELSDLVARYRRGATREGVPTILVLRGGTASAQTLA